MVHASRGAMREFRYVAIWLFSLLLFVGCESNHTIVNNIDERQANEIVVFLSSYGIAAQKMPSTSGGGVGGTGPSNMWNIAVPPTKTTEAMSILNRVGLPRRSGTTLLDLFGQTGLMSSDKQETIRYQMGLEKDLENMIRQIDGVVDSVVKLSFPEEQGIGSEATKEKPRAAVFVKHEGVVDNPNSHLVTKIRRLVASSVAELTFDNVTVVSDRSRFTDVSPQGDSLTTLPDQQMATVWSITMQESGVSRFRTLFLVFSLLIIFFALLAGWMAWKLYPLLPRGGLRRLFSLNPLVGVKGDVQTGQETGQEEAVTENPGEGEPPMET